MTATAVVEALAIPAEARIDRRVPKRTLLEQGASTAADKRLVQEGLDQLVWVAALKPGTVGIPAYRDAEREYLEVVVITATVRDGAKTPRLAELIHRAIPYPVLLVTTRAVGEEVSLAHKRLSQAERGRVVVDGAASAVTIASSPAGVESAFLASLAISRQQAGDLHALYQSWLDRLAALQAARLTGRFTLSSSPERTAEQRLALEEAGHLQREIAALRLQARSESQISRRVEINLALKGLEASLADQLARL
jgi:hypothetical protein